MNNTQPLGFFRRNFFPIHNHELKKFLPLSLIFFFIAFDYAILRALKDIMVITNGGSEAIAATKFWGVLPAMILFKFVYDDVSQRTGRIGRFNIVVGYFLLYYAAFAFLIYPNASALEAHGIADSLTRYIPFLKDTWNIIRLWPITVYYIHAEAWSTFVLSILFFTLANEITHTRQSGRFYPFLSITANIGTFIAGEFIRGSVMARPSVQTALIPVLVCGVLLMVVYTSFCKAIAKDPVKYEIEEKAPKKKKIKLSTSEAFKILFKNRYLLLIGFIVFAYALCINLFEAIYRDYLKEMAKLAAPDIVQEHLLKTGKILTLKQAQASYIQNYAGMQLSLIGIFAILFSLFLATPAMKLGWRFMGSVTPGILLGNTVLFLGILYWKGYFAFIANAFHITPAVFALIIGLMNVVFIKGSKYTFFDPFKENSFIPLDKQTKMLGKSSIEPLSRFGKAGGSLLITFFIAPLGGVKPFRLLLGLILVGIVVVWLGAVQNLTSRFHRLVAEQEGTNASDSAAGAPKKAVATEKKAPAQKAATLKATDKGAAKASKPKDTK